MIPMDDLAGVTASTERLLSTLEDLTDDVARRPSLLPGWTVGHVLTHLARNADSHLRRIDGSIRGEMVDQYPGGYEGRAADIEAGATRSAAELLDDVATTADALDAAWGTMPDYAWDAVTRDVSGAERPMSALPFRRWREVEVHHADLGLEFTVADWSDAYVAADLPHVLASLRHRTDPRALLAWALDRGDVPELAAWG